MFFVEPPDSPYDLRFTVAGVPVRVHPMFWAVTLLFGATADSRPQFVMLWMAAVFACILVHELGHVAAFRYYGMNAHVVLYAFGGLAVPSAGRWGGRGRSHETWLQDVVISLAGPVAGFAFAAVLLLGLAASGHKPQVTFNSYALVAIYWDRFQPWNLDVLLQYMQFINVFWGLVNLMPVFPLDGGQVSRALFSRLNPADGLRQSLVLSVFVAAGMAVLGYFHWHQLGIALMFGYMAYQNYLILQQISGGGYGGRW